ncbi:Transposase / integrase [Mycobacterium canettii CIPT 140060008]|uniref:IS21 family transposase n=4 Tax=Mycobacterium canetti TaxID=78331 RepID=A0ABV1MK34_9MYCO|nr:IS21 family transposase [Mycobacterium canetti]MBA2788495.1 IS21 family transposase [Mycobacterium canetti]CCC42495.1 integrase, catalytic region [Mycobacterium canettii CIPT 140010059]CCC44609.1 integrase, catalytic region [Mycobacterium canettii CIPT 140010059]CCC44885.1 integrase, catalytic region [Mycobacterium canettii CIPT 140010059]CCC45374.1 integrase, catalytic region [Mycobacterium canettii CIPT 140010059]
MKSAEEIMEILEAYDLTGSLRDAAELAGCSHHTVAEYVAARERGELTPGRAARREMLVDPYLDKLEEWVDRSRGKVRGDVAHEKLVALGYAGSQRTTRRAVAEVKAAYRAGRRRVHRPWITEPGMWFQYDFGDGPRVRGVGTQLFCAWLAWCRFRVVLALLDKTLPSVMAAIDTTLRVFGGVPTYALTDNEKTVTSEHVAGIPVRNAKMLDFARHYGLTIATCVPADPASKGGSENAVKIAKADLVPCEANLLPEYHSFAELQAACATFCQQVNNRPHRVTRRIPAEMLAEERARLHPLPAHPYTAAFGVTRTVPPNTAMITFEHGSYSVPHTLCGQTVWVRAHDQQVVVVHLGHAGPVEVARHQRTTPGNPRVDDAHFPPRPKGPLGRTPRAKTVAEAQFLALGDGAALWLTEAAAAGCSRIRAKMAGAVDLAALHDRGSVDRALGQAATAGRFGHGDLAAIVAHQAGDPDHHSASQPAHAGEYNSLAQGTGGWAKLGEQEAN